MEVAGSGIGAVIGGFKILMFVAPLLVIFNFACLGFFKSFNLVIRLLIYLGVYLGTISIEFFLSRLMGKDFLLFFIWVITYLFLMLFPAYVLSSWSPKMLVKARRILLIISVLVVSIIYRFTKTPKPYQNLSFEREVVNALNLSLVSTDSLYSARQIVIVDDTIAGFYEGNYVDRWVDGGPSFLFSGYFIRSLKDTAYHHIISTGGYINANNTLNFSKGSIIVEADIRGPSMKRIYPDGTQMNYFIDKKDHFHTSNRLIYNNLQVVSNDLEFLICDEITQRLLLEKPKRSFNTLAGSYFFFLDEVEGKIQLICFDLKRLKVVWNQAISASIRGGAARTTEEQDLSITDNYLAFKNDDAAYILEKETGAIKDKYLWEFPMYENMVMIDNNFTYVSDGKLIKNYCLNTGEKRWQIRNAKLYGLYSQFVIASSIDEKSFIIIKKRSGEIVKHIKRSDDTLELRLIGNYILINTGHLTSIYK